MNDDQCQQKVQQQRRQQSKQQPQQPKDELILDSIYCNTIYKDQKNNDKGNVQFILSNPININNIMDACYDIL